MLLLPLVLLLLASRLEAFTTGTGTTSSRPSLFHREQTPNALGRQTRTAGPPLLVEATTLPSSTTTEEEERLTDKEEEILFGSEEEERSKSPERKKDKFGNILNDDREPNPLDHASDPIINKLHTVRDTIQSCPELWSQVARVCPDLRAVFDEHMCDETVDQSFAQFAVTVRKSAAVFQKLGVQKGTHVAVFAENSARWLMVDQGLQMAGGASAVRGADAPLDELRYIYEHSDSVGIAVLQGPKLLQKLAKQDKSDNNAAPLGLTNEKYGPVKTVLLMHREKKTDAEIAQMAAELGIQIRVFADLVDAVADDDSIVTAKNPPVVLSKSDLATIVYTSGTTGRPKGVMLTHGNLLHQTGHRLGPSRPYEESEPLPGEKMVSLLPVWHITERAFELWIASRGCSVVYSSIRTFKKDLAKHKPEWMVLVPRVLEKVAAGVQDKFASGSAAVKVLSSLFTSVGKAHAKHKKIVKGLVVGDLPPGILELAVSKLKLALLNPLHAVGKKLVWSKVQDGFGGNLKVIISGGSALAGGLESFYEAAGFTVCVGYGLTECSPLISFRRSDANLVTGGCAGKACLDSELRVVDPNYKVPDDESQQTHRQSLPDGEAGLIIAKGPQVMKGYYKNKEATAKAIDRFGWFDTGDLGRINPATGDLILTGRAKDTIVLSNGENIEPVPIEDAILGAAPLIDQVMLTGQDGRSLIAITVLNPSELGNEGFLDRKLADELQEASDKVNDPTCSPEDCKKNSKVLNDAVKALRANRELDKNVADIFRTATSNFRQWERVNDFYLTLEPFAMANGQLTQSYKVKRDQVVERYKNELPS